MDIKFADKKLEQYANNPRLSQQKMGEKRTKLFLKRLTDLRDADTLEDVRHLPGHYHPLKIPRKGQFACDLDHPYRLIFIPQQNQIPTNKDGQYIWIEILGVEIIEIIDYHE